MTTQHTPQWVPLPSKQFPGWFEIPGYERYAANERGQILSKKTRNYTYGGNAGRYLKVSTYRDGDEAPTLRYVHDLVARAFYGPPPNIQAPVVLHADNNRRNNARSNLSWGTQSANIRQVYEDGLKFSHRYADRFAARREVSVEGQDLGYSVFID